MKITEIEVGKVYFSSTSRDWQYAWWGVKKVRVVTAENTYWEWDRIAKQYKKTSASYYRSRKGIVVEVLNEHSNAVEETTVVPLGSLRGLWDVVAPVVKSNRDARDVALQVHSDGLAVAYKAVAANYQKAKALGLVGVGSRGSENTVTPETMAMLLEMWAAHREA